MLLSPYILACALLVGVGVGFFFSLRTVGIAAVVIYGADIAAMFIAGAIGAREEVVWIFGIAGMVLPLYAVLTFIGAQAGRTIREKFDTKS